MSFGDTSQGFNEWALGDDEAEPIFRQGRFFRDDDQPIDDAVQQVARDSYISARGPPGRNVGRRSLRL
ncbi:hypothetical protein AB0N24_15225 [Arthrobacter sp. NPDC093128]|uniref:hypothetical protein n=1 Tax=Arthrobacter sp. NPDC093128 TaxID=3154979 RepID=UPI0034284D39